MATNLQLIEQRIRSESETKLRAKIDKNFPATVAGVSPNAVITFKGITTVGAGYKFQDVVNALRDFIFSELKEAAFNQTLDDFLTKAEKVP